MSREKIKMVGKRANLSLETIAVGAIVLVVLIVVIVIFKGGVDNIFPTVSKANDCEPRNTCVKGGACSGGQEVYGLGCEKKPDAKYCCVKKKEND